MHSIQTIAVNTYKMPRDVLHVLVFPVFSVSINH